MKFSDLKRSWEQFGKEDPLWAILTDDTKKGNRWDPDEFFKTGKINVSWIMRRQDELGIVAKKEHALDFGCGVGRLTQALCDHYEMVTGVDISSSMIELAQRYNRFRGRCTYLVNQKPDLSQFQDCSFDAIYSFIVLQHMESRYSRNYIKEFMRILKPGGVLVFQMPADPIGEKKFFRTMKKIPALLLEKIQLVRQVPILEMHCARKPEIVELIEQNKGKIIKIEEDGWAGPAYRSYTYWILR